MVSYNANDYLELLGSIPSEHINAVSCMGQCTGCKCSCKCSCRAIESETFEWEEF